MRETVGKLAERDKENKNLRTEKEENLKTIETITKKFSGEKKTKIKVRGITKFGKKTAARFA